MRFYQFTVPTGSPTLQHKAEIAALATKGDPARGLPRRGTAGPLTTTARSHRTRADLLCLHSSHASST